MMKMFYLFKPIPQAGTRPSIFILVSIKQIIFLLTIKERA